MNLLARVPRTHRVVFLLSFGVALLFAGYTNHVWEDYYITFRASKNLATGHGLVFNHGDRLHTFTSPIGVLLPALASAATLNNSDTGALWIFRMMSAAAFAGAVTLFYGFVRGLADKALLACLATLWLVLDAKSLDFSINGMETGFLLLFVAWAFCAQFGTYSRRWLWLGLAWAGIMWTRPDGFLYIGLLAVGGWLFNDRARTGISRTEWLKIFGLAALVCTAAYLPWFLSSWAYYGTPIPHTITAKAAMSSGRTIIGAVTAALQLPKSIWTGDTSAHVAFLPSYFIAGGWPAALEPIAKFLAYIAAFAWVVPRIGTSIRAASFTFFGLHVYLSYYPYFPFPWYLPGTTLLAYFVFAGLLAKIAVPEGLIRQRLVGATALCVLGFNAWIVVAVARQVSAAQIWVEDGNRRKIGEWLKEQSAPGDRVFMEPLGYIGYFSGIKTYDFPGMSSREMVNATSYFCADWARIIDYLYPEWLVLRPIEAQRINNTHPHLLTATYKPAREFDVLADVKKLSIPGRPNLEFDARFIVYRKEPLNRYASDDGEFHARFPVSITTIGDRGVKLVHAPGTWILKVPPEARHVRVAFGYVADAYKDDPKTDGAVFSVRMTEALREHPLMVRHVDPAVHPSHQGIQIVDLALPSRTGDALLHLTATPGATDVKDWTCWAMPEFR